jgi:hypothetical protein
LQFYIFNTVTLRPLGEVTENPVSRELRSFHTLLRCAKPDNIVHMNELCGMMVNARLYAVGLLRAWDEVCMTESGDDGCFVLALH